MQTLRELSLYQPDTLLLPNLHTLNFKLAQDAVPFARLFLRPCTTEVAIQIMPESAELLSALVPDISPDILRLHISSATSIPDPCQCSAAIFQLIGRSHKLRDLNIHIASCGLHERIAAILGRFSSLSRLKISLIQSSHLRFYTTALGQFPLLTDFSFEVDDWTSATTIMDSMHCRFTNLAVRAHKHEPLDLSELRTFTESISRHRSVSSLTHLSLIDFQRLDNTDDQTYVEDILSPLFALTGLTSVNLTGEMFSYLGNSWYADAATAWPSLESICILSSLRNAKMTLAGLIPLVQHCTKLESVALRLDAQPFDPTQVNDISNPNIRRLCLDTYIVPSPRDVFLSLIKIFPNLEDVYQVSQFPLRRWDEVNQMLDESAVRRRGPRIFTW